MNDEEEKAKWRAGIDEHIVRFDDSIGRIDGKLQILAAAQSETNAKLDQFVGDAKKIIEETREIMAVAAVARKVGLWSRMVASFVEAKATWSARAARWFSFNVMRPVGFFAAAVVALWQAYVQIPWHDLWTLIKRHL